MKKRGRGFDESWTSKKNPAQKEAQIPKDLLEVMAAEEKLTGGGLPQAGKKDEIVKPMTDGVINSTIRWSKVSHSDWI